MPQWMLHDSQGDAHECRRGQLGQATEAPRWGQASTPALPGGGCQGAEGLPLVSSGVWAPGCRAQGSGPTWHPGAGGAEAAHGNTGGAGGMGPELESWLRVSAINAQGPSSALNSREGVLWHCSDPRCPAFHLVSGCLGFSTCMWSFPWFLSVQALVGISGCAHTSHLFLEGRRQPLPYKQGCPCHQTSMSSRSGKELVEKAKHRAAHGHRSASGLGRRLSQTLQLPARSSLIPPLDELVPAAQ